MNESVAIISDIHGNLQALQAVIADIENQGISERLCLGDIVGYGAQPAECIELLLAKGFETIRGNHDTYAATDGDLVGFSADAKQAIDWTRHHLSAVMRAWLRSLPLHFRGKDYEAVHASLHHPDEWGYILDPGAAALHFRHQEKDVCFIGHSHQPKMFRQGDDCARDTTSIEDIRERRKQVVNVGSVGQPRDKNERACYVIYRRAQADIWWKRVAYDIDGAQNAIMAAGLPGKYAHRLSFGK